MINVFVFHVTILLNGQYKIHGMGIENQPIELMRAEKYFKKAVKLWGRPLPEGSYVIAVSRRNMGMVTTYGIDRVML